MVRTNQQHVRTICSFTLMIASLVAFLILKNICSQNFMLSLKIVILILKLNVQTLKVATNETTTLH